MGINTLGQADLLVSVTPWNSSGDKVYSTQQPPSSINFRDYESELIAIADRMLRAAGRNPMSDNAATARFTVTLSPDPWKTVSA